MNWTFVRLSAFIACCVSAAGCTICQNARRTVWDEPRAYSWKHDRRRSAEAYRQWADAALYEEAERCPDLLGEPDYAMGFRDGFVDFVYAGGTGEPPPVPPRQFWNVMLRSPDGKRRANQWFEGYRHGAAAARDGGYRELGTVQSSLFGIASGAPYAGYSPMTPESEMLDVEAPPHDGELLPEPNRAPQLPSPFETNDTPEIHSVDEPALEPEPTVPKALRDEPFKDDPQPPVDEAGDPSRPVSDWAPATEPNRSESESNDGAMILGESSAAASDVEPAILITLNQDGDKLTSARAPARAEVSSARFVVKPGPNNPNTAPHHIERSSSQWPGTNSAAAGATNEETNRHNFRGWSRRAAAEGGLEQQ